MQPYNDAENAWLSTSSHPENTVDPSWLTNAQVDLHIRRAERMRSEVIHRAYCKASTANRTGRFCGR